MFKKYLLPGFVVAALTACGGGQDLNYGPVNDSLPDEPPPAPEYVPQWQFSPNPDETLSDRESLDMANWAVEWNKPGSGNADDSEIYWHASQFALGVQPKWGGEDVAKLDNVTVYGTLDEPMDISFGTIYLSLYYPREHLGNPWGTGPYWGESAHHMGTQYLLIDASGNRVLLDTGNGSNWMNSFDIGNPDVNQFLRLDSDARGNQTEESQVSDNADGFWFDLAIKVGNASGFEPDVHYYPNEDNTSDFDVTNVVSFGVVMQYALEKPELQDLTSVAPGDELTEAQEYWDELGGASERYIFLDDIALVPGVRPPPPPVEPPPALEASPEFGLPIYREVIESGFNDAWGGYGATADFASTYGARSEKNAIAITFDGAGSGYQIGGPDTTLDLTQFGTLDLMVWVDSANELDASKLWISLCDCDDGIEVSVVKEQWNVISIPVADFGKDSLFGAMGIKNNSSAGGVFYIDDLGFDKVPDRLPPNFDVPVYLDGIEAGFSDAWGGWGGSWTWDSNERVQDGSSAVKLEYDAGSWGAMQIGADDLDLSVLSTFHFSMYVEGTGSHSIFVSMCDCDNGVAVDVEAGQWNNITIPLSEFTETTLTGAMRIKNNTADAKVAYLDNVGFDEWYTPEFAVPVYHEGVETGFSDAWGGWGGEWTWDSTEEVQTGETSIKLSYDAGSWGALQLGANDLDLTTLSSFHFSAFVEGEGTHQLFISMCDCDSGVAVDVTGGEWNRVTIDLSEFTETTLTGAMRIKNNSADAKVVHIDDIGFDLLLPPIYDVPVYSDGIEAGFSDAWGGWGGEWDWASTEVTYQPATAAFDDGATSIELSYVADSWGAMQIGADDLDLTTLSTFNFYAYVPVGTGTSQLFVSMCDCDNGIAVDIEEGKWVRVEMDLTDFTETTLTGAMRIKNNSADAKVIYVDHIGFIQ